MHPAKKQCLEVEAFDPVICARRLADAWLTGESITERGAHFSPPDVASVYAVHEALRVNTAVGALGGVVGYKMGGTAVATLPNGEPTPALPGMLLGPPHGLGSPEFGVVAEGIRLPKSRCNYSNVEAEIGFTMKATPTPASTCFPLTEQDVLAAVGECFLAIEACGSRYAVKSPSFVADPLTPLEKSADSQSAGAVVRGRSWRMGCAGSPTAEDLAALDTSISVNGAQVATGGASLVPLNSPLASLTWLANHLPSRGQCLRAGETVITGACSKTKAFAVGDTIVANFGDLGTVELTFS